MDSDVNSLADGILSLWNDRGVAAELGRRGARGVRQHYSATRMATLAVDAYRRIGYAAVHA